jgi:hypothetical protein
MKNQVDEAKSLKESFERSNNVRIGACENQNIGYGKLFDL